MPRTKARADSLPGRWAEELHLCPGFDPFEAAGDSTFDASSADFVVGFFEECLVHVDGKLAGQHIRLEPWQRGMLGNLFGWKRPDGTRRFREALVYVPRKNGKSTIAAGIGLYLFICDDEPGAEVYIAAGEREQAAIIFRTAASMVEYEPELDARCKVYRGYYSIQTTGIDKRYLRALSSKASSKHGYKPHGAIIDELHVLQTADLVEVLHTGTGARRQPLTMYTTTADYWRPSICNQKYDYACKVRDGIIRDPGFLPAIWEADLEDDWTSPEVWQKANPNLGISVSRSYLERECRRAKDSPEYENTFKRLHLNIRTEADVRFFRMEAWQASAGSVDEAELQGRDCYAGLDLSSTRDLTALALVFPFPHGVFKVLPFFWVPGAIPEEKEQRDRVPYLTWQRQGHLEIAGEKVIDYNRVLARICELGKRYRIRSIAYDPHNAQQTANDLEGEGFKTFAFTQSWPNFAEPTKEIERLVTLGKLHHGNNPVLTWNAANTMVRQDSAGNIRPQKPDRNEPSKIDGIVATIMGLARAMLAPPVRESVYNSRGLW